MRSLLALFFAVSTFFLGVIADRLYKLVDSVGFIYEPGLLELMQLLTLGAPLVFLITGAAFLIRREPGAPDSASRIG